MGETIKAPQFDYSNTSDAGLKFLFTVKFKDGSGYKQNKADVSLLDPDKRSCFYDVAQRIDEVESFSLSDGKNIFLVDIVDGHFEINKVPFHLHDSAQPLMNRRLIFFRQHTVSQNVDIESKILIGDPSHSMTYHFGWQANDENGKNIQHVIEIA